MDDDVSVHAGGAEAAAPDLAAGGGALGTSTSAAGTAATAATAGAAPAPQEDAEDSDSDLLDLMGPLTTQPSAVLSRQLLAADDSKAALQHRLLKVAAGMYGDNSLNVFHELQPQLLEYNQAQRASGRSLLQVSDLQERWFLERSVLHLLVSKVRVWGIAGDEVPQGFMSAATRTQLLQQMCGDPAILRALIRRGNRNRATPVFTAAHFCEPAALEWLLSRPEVGFKDMLQYTKRGRQGVGRGAGCACGVGEVLAVSQLKTVLLFVHPPA